MSNASSELEPAAARRQWFFKKSPKKSENLGRPLRLVINTLLIFLASQLLAIFIVGIIYGLVRPGVHASLDNSVVAQFFYILIAEGLAAWLVIRIV
ncbi:MAG TPA: hypothetical protein VH234_06020, partial [Candidatus Saccharimonadales bacterium]|nr:hypothetical protein [Candidatus Saccharimonadales bacterium]